MARVSARPIYDINSGLNGDVSKFAQAELSKMIQAVKQRKHRLRPILVYRNSGSATGFEIAFGEIAFRAAKRSNALFVDVIEIEPIGPREKEELVQIELTDIGQRNVIEQGEIFARVRSLSGVGVRQLSRVLGRSHSEVSRRMRYLELPEKVQEAARQGKLLEGHLKLLLARPARVQEDVGARAAAQAWTVGRLREALNGEDGSESGEGAGHADDMTGYLKRLACRIGEHLGAEVDLRTSPRGRALQFEIAFNSQETLGGVLEQLSRRLEGAKDLERWQERGSLILDVPRWEMIEELLDERRWE